MGAADANVAAVSMASTVPWCRIHAAGTRYQWLPAVTGDGATAGAEGMIVMLGDAVADGVLLVETVAEGVVVAVLLGLVDAAGIAAT